MEEEEKQFNIGGGLISLPKDIRDFTLGSIFGERIIPPNYDFIIAEPLGIKNQYSSDMCTAFACCAVSEDQENVLLSPEWFFAQVKKGNKSWGANLRDVCRTACEVGFLEQSTAPCSLQNATRDFLINRNNWPDLPIFYKEPLEHKKLSYFSVDIQGDVFDSFRSTLFQHQEQKCTILTGCLWQKEWTNCPGGIIPEEDGTLVEGHAFKIFGQKNINGKLYLVAQLSNGTEIGDNGLFYFSREVANKVFKGYGAFCFIDEDADEIKKNTWKWYQRIYDFIIKITKIFTK